MSAGALVAVVGPSGVGKDSVMAGIAAAAPGVRLVRRTITRAAGLDGETYDAVTRDAFARAAQDGAFCLHWEAHGLCYGIPADVPADLRRGVDCLANLSRSALPAAASVFPRLRVLNVTASAEVLARRLSARGRESAAEIEARLARRVEPLPPGLDVVTISNDGPLEATVTNALAALQPLRA